MRFPGGVGVVVEVVRVFDQVSEFVGVGPVEDLIGRTQPLDAQVTEGPQQHSRREMLRIGYAQKGLDHRPEGDRYKPVVRRGASDMLAQQRVPPVMLGNAVLRHIPRPDGRARPVEGDLKRRAQGRICSPPSNIGKASWRERGGQYVEISVVAVSLK